MPHCSFSTGSLAQRALACSKPRGRTLEQINLIAEFLSYQPIFEGLGREDLLAVAYFIESKHSEAGECVLSKGQPLEQWYLLLSGTTLLTRYSCQRGAEQTTTPLGPNDSWSEAALLHSTHPRRSSVTVVAGPQGCVTLRLRYSDYDAMNDMRNPLQLLPPEGTQGPQAVSEITAPQRRASSIALLSCCLRRLASARPPDARTPEEASEMEPLIASLPSYRAYPLELVGCLAAACRATSLPPGSLVYEHGTLADAHVTVLSGEVQLRRLGMGGQGQAEEDQADAGTAAAGASGSGGTGSTAGAVRPVPPPGQKPGAAAGTGLGPGSQQAQQPGEAPEETSGGRLNFRARLRREREARKLMQRQLDEYVSRMDSEHPADDGKDGSGAVTSSSSASASSSIKDPVGASPMDWTRVFMQKAMRTVEPVWKALHPADKAPRRRPGGGDALDAPLDGSEGPITEVAQLLGPAAAKAYYRGLQSQGYSDSESPPRAKAARASDIGGGGGGRDGSSKGREASARARWRRSTFSVDGPETPHERTLRNMAMRASRIYREQHARSRGSTFDADEVEEMYGTQYASLTRGSPVGELSTVTLHSTMRKESAVAGPGGCELLLVDWEAYQQGVLAARAAALARAAPFLGSLPQERLTQLAELCLCLIVEQGTLLARQGTPLECMVVVQDGEVTLFHEPSAALHTRISTIRGQAVSRSRNGRTQLWPLLATLSSTNLPGLPTALTATNPTAAAAATSPSTLPATATGAGAAGTAAGGAVAGSGGSFTGASGGAVMPSPPAGAGGSFTRTSSGAPVEITLQGLPLGELGVGGILGEAILGARSVGVGGPAAHLDPSHHGNPHSHAQGQGQGPHAGGGGGEPHTHAAGQSVAAAVLATTPLGVPEGPKWPATVLAARASVLLVIPRSVLYMPKFDLIRSDLVRFATERRTWLSRRVEAAYRAAAAPPTTPAVFANGAAAAAAANAPGAPAAAPPGGMQQPPTPRRPGHGGDGGGGAPPPHVGSFPRRTASGDVSAIHAHGGGGGGTAAGESGASSGAATPHYPMSRRRSVESIQRSTSPANPAAAAAAAATAAAVVSLAGGASASGSLRSPTKWDFLDMPTGAATTSTATSASVTAGGMDAASSVPLAPSGGSFSRGGLSLLDSANSQALVGGGGGGGGGSGLVLTGSFTAGSPRRRGSKDIAAAAAAAGITTGVSISGGSVSGGGGPDLFSGLNPVQQAILEVGLDPLLFGTEAPSPGGGGGAMGLERHGSAASSVAPLPALPSRGLAPLIVASGGGGSCGGSPATSADFDALRATGVPTPFRSPNALTPTNWRSANGAPGPIPPSLSAPVSLLDGGGIALSPSSQITPGVSFPIAAANAVMRVVRSSHCGTTGGGRRRTDADGSGGLPPPGALTAPPPTLSPRIPALQALDALETAVASSGGLLGRHSRASCTGGVTPRIGSVDSLWASAGGRGAFAGGLRGGAGGRLPTRDGGGGGGMNDSGLVLTDAEADEEAALARSLVPKNQAGLFMVRGGASSTLTKQPAVRRIAGCF